MEIAIGKATSYVVDYDGIEQHVASIDNELQKEYKLNGYSDRYFQTLDERCITYREFLQLYDGRITDFLEHIPFQYLGISTEHGFYSDKEFIHGRYDFTEKYEKSEAGYMEMLTDFTGERFFIKPRVNVPVGSLKRHCQIVGKTGEGKSNAMRLLIYSLQDYGYGIVLLDPHGDLSKQIKESSLNTDDRLVYVSSALNDELYPVINPLQLTGKNDKRNIEKTTEFLVEAFDELLNDQDMSGQMRSILTPCIYTLLYNGGYSLQDLQRFMLDDPELISLGMQSPIPQHAEFFKHKYKTTKESRTYTTTKNSIYTRIQNLLNYPRFYHMTHGENTIDLRHAMNNKKVVVFDMSGLGGISKEAYGRFVIAQIKAIAEDRERMKAERRPSTFLFIDECQNYITKSVEKTLAEMRKYGLHLILAHQHIDQLGDMRNAVLSNTDVKIVFKNHKGTLSQFTSYMELELKDMMNNWKQYECWIKSGDRKAVKVKFTDKLITKKKYTLKPEEIKALEQQQIGKYYRKAQLSTSSKNEPVQTASSDPIKLEDEDF